MSHKHTQRMNEIEYWCSQLIEACSLTHLPDIFSVDFMHEYTTFLSFAAMMNMLHADASSVRNVNDLVRMDTAASDSCVAEHSEFASWKELVKTACDYYIAANIK